MIFFSASFPKDEFLKSKGVHFIFSPNSLASRMNGA